MKLQSLFQSLMCLSTIFIFACNKTGSTTSGASQKNLPTDTVKVYSAKKAVHAQIHKSVEVPNIETPEKMTESAATKPAPPHKAMKHKMAMKAHAPETPLPGSLKGNFKNLPKRNTGNQLREL